MMKGLKGVSFNKATGRYVATLTIDGKRSYLGYHATEEEAHLAYLVAKKAALGEKIETALPPPADTTTQLLLDIKSELRDIRNIFEREE